MQRKRDISKNAEPAIFRPTSKAAWRCWDYGASVITRVAPTLPTIVKAFAAKRVHKSADGQWLVRGDDVSVVVKSHDAAVRLIEKAVLADIGPTYIEALKSIRALMFKAVNDDQVALDPEREAKRREIDDLISTHLNAGTSSPLDDETINASGQPLTDPKKIRERVTRSQRNVRLL